MYESDSKNELGMSINLIVHIAEIKREIAHMDVEIEFHQSQTRAFEKLVQKEQKILEIIESSDHENCA